MGYMDLDIQNTVDMLSKQDVVEGVCGTDIGSMPVGAVVSGLRPFDQRCSFRS